LPLDRKSFVIVPRTERPVDVDKASITRRPRGAAADDVVAANDARPKALTAIKTSNEKLSPTIALKVDLAYVESESLIFASCGSA
jgi:hypothetical protein